jgi:hypothetical protein
MGKIETDWGRGHLAGEPTHRMVTSRASSFRQVALAADLLKRETCDASSWLW